VVLSGLFTGLKLTTATEVVISIITTVVAAIIMATSVRVVSILNSIGVVLELAVLLIAAVGLLFHTHQSLSVLGNTGGVAGSGSYLWPFLVVVALVVTQLVGFETAGAFAEETNKARIKPSQAIIAGLAGTALILFIFDFALLLAIPGVKSAMADPSLIPDVLTAALGSGFAKLFLVGALVAVFSTAIATLATIVRMIYGMARNEQLPGSAFLTKLSGHTREPIGTIIVAAVLSILPLIFIKKIPVIVASITALIIIPYIMVLGSVLWRRLRGWPSEKAQFNLGRWGMPITVAGIVWTVIILLDAAWPREITNPTLGPMPVIEDLGIGAIIVGLGWWFVSLRHKSGVQKDVAPDPARRQ
jgi:amino acid transporter